MNQQTFALLTIRAIPNAKKDEVIGDHGDAIKVRLRAPAVEGKANRGLIQFFATQLKLSRNQIEIVGGEKTRNKQVRIDGINLKEARKRLGL